MESRASRFDEAGARARVEQLKQGIRGHQAELDALPALRELTQQHQELYAAVTRLDNQVGCCPGLSPPSRHLFVVLWWSRASVLGVGVEARKLLPCLASRSVGASGQQPSPR